MMKIADFCNLLVIITMILEKIIVDNFLANGFLIYEAEMQNVTRRRMQWTFAV
jgi:hypothetical protein